MKTEIKNKVQKIIETHGQVKKEYEKIDEQIKAWEKDTVYSAEHKCQQIKQLEQEKISGLKGIDAMLNKQLKELVAEEKSKLFNQTTKPADYQMQIANALEFIKLAGKNLNDKQAMEILKPFQGDFETMNLFQAVVNNLTEPGVTKSFQKTFEKTNELLAVHNNFDAIEQLAANLFDSNNSNSLVYGTKIGMFMANVDAVDALSNYQNE